MPTIDSRNHFYLGRDHDLATGETADDSSLLYASKDLTTHAMCVGMTGSGKTGLCVSLIEEALLDGVPVIAIDPKGDLGNLLLAFPELKPADFRPWVDESAAARKGLTPDELAAKTAELWRSGLDKWDNGTERLQQYHDCCERLIFTPGSSAGIPLTVLKSFDAPPAELRRDDEAMAERVSSAVSGLLALVGIDADPVQSREHILLSNLLTHAWRAGKDVTVADLIGSIQQPPFEKVGVLDLDQFFPEKARTKLAMELNNLLASPTFAGWMRGAPLDVDQLLFAPPDGSAGLGNGGKRKPRLSILSIAHLDDSQRMFFVTVLLNEVVAWMRTQSGTSSLRAILYMDEVLGYFPPVANPPSKAPMLTLLKQARAFGLGVVLATQNPVDLDYKGLSNCGTWLLGRLQTERDKARVIEGLEGASAEAGAAFDKQAMEQTLAGLGSRVFLMNNVHDEGPRVFHTRWALSYLAGPLARDRIEQLMDPVRDKFLPPPDDDAKGDAKAEEPKATDEKPGEPATPTPSAVTVREVQEIKDRYKKRIADAEAAVTKSREYYSEQKWQVPGKLFTLITKGAVLISAYMSGGATKRRSQSAVSAFEQAQKEFSQAWRARGKWKAARRELKDLQKERDEKIAEVESRMVLETTDGSSAAPAYTWAAGADRIEVCRYPRRVTLATCPSPARCCSRRGASRRRWACNCWESGRAFPIRRSCAPSGPR
ncbi:MAG: DUF87 domain-containing protein [Planctomycetota bacterium]